MIGQEKLLNKLKDYSLDTFPRSVLLEGKRGCGKHLFCKEISKKLNLELVDITKNLTLEYINEIYINPIPKIYLIDVSLISIKEQNIILKFVEEPLKNSYILLLCENENQVIATLKNRCQKWIFENYKDFELSSFAPGPLDDYYFKIFDTPGKLLSIGGVDLKAYEELSVKMVDKLKVASLPNTLSISEKIAFKNEKDKLNFQIFIDIMCFYFNKSDNLSILNEIKNYRKNSLTPQVNQKMLFENLLINLWRLYRSGT